jgi:signal transduction histidine kinase
LKGFAKTAWQNARPFGTCLNKTLVIRKIVALLLLTAWTSWACAQDHLRDTAYWEDPTGRTHFEQLPTAEFHPFTGLLSQGYSHSAFWIRLQIDPAGSDEPLILRIQPNYLDEISLYDPAFGVLGQAVRGDEQPDEDDYHSLNFNFTLPPGQTKRDIWLRVRSTSSLLFSAQVLDRDAAARVDLIQQLKSGFYLAFIGLFIIWGSLQYWARRDPVLALFVLKQTLCLVFMAGMLGYVRQLWPSHWSLTAGTFLDFSMGPYAAAAFAFEYRFLREYRPHRLLLNLLRVMPAFLPVYWLLLARGDAQAAFLFCMVLMVIAPILTFLLALTARPPRNLIDEPSMAPTLSRRALVIAYALILIGLSFTTVPSLGIAYFPSLVFDGMLVYSLVSGLTILILLQLRIRNGERRRQGLEIHHQEVQQLYAEEQQRREEQARFLAMLTHELRTPLSVVSMALGNAQQPPGTFADAERSIDDMAAILERCLTVDQLEGGRIATHRQLINAVDELRDLAQRSTEPARISLDLPAHDVNLSTDVTLFRLIVANLLDNALKYRPKDAPVTLSLAVSPDHLNIDVVNPPGKAGWPDATSVFQKYYRSPRAQQITGTGLGLYLAHQLSHSLGGQLQYNPTATHIRFSLCLPR